MTRQRWWGPKLLRTKEARQSACKHLGQSERRLAEGVQQIKDKGSTSAWLTRMLWNEELRINRHFWDAAVCVCVCSPTVPSRLRLEASFQGSVHFYVPLGGPLRVFLILSPLCHGLAARSLDIHLTSQGSSVSVKNKAFQDIKDFRLRMKESPGALSKERNRGLRPTETGSQEAAVGPWICFTSSESWGLSS